jgi:hypothetical protein
LVFHHDPSPPSSCCLSSGFYSQRMHAFIAERW